MRKESSISVYASRKIILKDSWRDSGYYERYMLSKETLLPDKAVLEKKLQQLVNIPQIED